MVITPGKILCSIVRICVLDHAQTTKDFEMCPSNYRNVPVKIFNCNVNNKTKDCAFHSASLFSLQSFITSPSINYVESNELKHLLQATDTT